MTSAKAWYWLGLGLLAVSFMSSGPGRSALTHAASYATCIRARALPYVGAVELATGRTQAGYAHLQASMEQTRARMEQTRARVEAHQAQIEAAQRMVIEARIREQLRDRQQVRLLMSQ